MKQIKRPNVDRGTVSRYMTDLELCKPKWFMVLKGVIYITVMCGYTALWMLAIVRNV